MNDPRNQPRPVGHPQPGAPQAPRPVIPHHTPPPARPGIAPMPTQPVGTDAELDPIELVEDEMLLEETGLPGAGVPQAAPPLKSKIKAFGHDTARKEHNWKRVPFKSGTGACRVKTFHGKYSDQGMEHLDDMINEWLDNHPEVEVKFVTSTVNTFEGKIREPALVLNLWY